MLSRRPLIAGNWKMNKTVSETEDFIRTFLANWNRSEKSEVLLLPPFTSLTCAEELLQGKGIALGAQDIHFEEKGAFTGAVSATMVRACGCRYVLVGHSERRALFHDDDRVVSLKLLAALKAGLSPILCIGETLEEHEEVEKKITSQLAADLAGVDQKTAGKVTIAYEPIWAIGTGRTATPDVAQETIAMIRQWVAANYDEATANGARILYGGSVKPENAASLLAQPDIDGALVGGASLSPEAFAAIVACVD